MTAILDELASRTEAADTERVDEPPREPTLERTASGVTRQAITVRAQDGYALSAELFLPAGAPKGAVVVASAMGVKKRFYGPFAAFLAEHGLAALTFDYRGIGGSLQGPLAASRARLRDWGELDVAAALADQHARFPALPLSYVAHSVGGQVFGLVREAPVARAAFVGSQSGYWKHWDGLGRAAMFGLWFGLIPAVVPVVRRLPMKAFGQGEDVPPGVAHEWAAWGRHPDYVGAYAAERPGLGFHRWAGRLRAFAISDDAYAPEKAVRALVRLYTRAEGSVRVVTPAQLGVSKIGHFAPFTRAFEATLWPELRDFALGLG